MTDPKMVMFEEGQRQARAIQEASAIMTGTELYAAEGNIPAFAAAKKTENMLTRNIGFVCKSTAGRVVRLLQNYDSDVFPQEPEELSAQWGFFWSDDPAKALPFVSVSTSPYMKGNCCTENGTVYRSVIDNNVWSPSVYSTGWEVVA